MNAADTATALHTQTEENVVNEATEAAADTDVLVYVRLRPQRNAADKALAALHDLTEAHRSVGLHIAGVAADARSLHLTLAINCGPRRLIAKHSPVAHDAHAFVSAIFTDLFEFLPQYAPEPSPAAVAAVALLDRVTSRPITIPTAPSAASRALALV